jgi:hypothetical protein
VGNPQRLSDNEQLEILALLEAVSTERSAMRAARALAELMGYLHGLGSVSPVSCLTLTATSSQPGACALAGFTCYDHLTASRPIPNVGEGAISCRFRPGSFVGQVAEPPEAEEGHMAKYLILIYGPESDAAPTPEQWDWMMQAHGQFAQAVDQQGGKILGGEALQPTATATSVRNDGQAVTDGPFVAAKEALGGFYLIEATDLDQALAFAKQCPAPDGGVELRPIMDTSGGQPSA